MLYRVLEWSRRYQDSIRSRPSLFLLREQLTKHKSLALSVSVPGLTKIRLSSTISESCLKVVGMVTDKRCLLNVLENYGILYKNDMTTTRARHYTIVQYKRLLFLYIQIFFMCTV